MRRPAWQVWPAGHRTALAGLLAVAVAALAVARWTRPVTVADPPADGPRAAELSTRVDPNVADAATLSAVPGLGDARAAAIVDYRTAYAARHPDRPPFGTARDLLPVHGIGASMVNNLAPYLTFPATRPAR